jgi:uncharacterized membrane protein (DUF441 family)
MSEAVTVVVAVAKLAGLGISLVTFHPVTAQRLVSSTVLAAVSVSAALDRLREAASSHDCDGTAGP